MNKVTRKVVIVVASLLIAWGLFFGGTLLFDTMRYRRIISEVEIRTPDLTQIQDGRFNRVFDAILVSKHKTDTADMPTVSVF